MTDEALDRAEFIRRVEELWPGTLDKWLAEGLDAEWLDESPSYGLVNALLLDFVLLPILDTEEPQDSEAIRATFRLVEELLSRGTFEMADAASIELGESLGVPPYFAKARDFAGPLLRQRLDEVHNWRPE